MTQQLAEMEIVLVDKEDEQGILACTCRCRPGGTVSVNNTRLAIISRQDIEGRPDVIIVRQEKKSA
jgi:hypothetical protein